jgi:DNA-binding MarR family transcriptional regulator
MTDVSPQPPAGTAPPLDSEGRLDVSRVLGAFRALQKENERVERLVAIYYEIGTSDLRCLRFVGENPASTPKATAEFLELSTGATTSLIDRLETAGLVHRAPHPTDRRSVVLELAPSGRTAIDEIDEFYRGAFRDAVDPAHLDFLAVAMQAIGDSLTRAAAQADAELAAAQAASRS